MSITESQYGISALDDDKLVGKGVKFERIRRITGYLVGTLDRFNNAKYAEVQDRVAHMKVGLSK